jgi:methylenetetrahydrofolate dehydrogenase (NADP+)/methenyltetrahydrofolate cyclohydrolase
MVGCAVAHIIDGKAIAEEIHRDVARSVAEWRRAGRGVKLVCVMAGQPDAGTTFSRSQAARCQQAGIDFQLLQLPADSGAAALQAAIDGLNRDRSVTGIMLNLPLPAGIDPARLQYAIDPFKDVEGVNPANIGFVFYGRPIIAPCTALSILEILRKGARPLRGQHVVIVGQGAVVGRPVTLLLLQELATVTACHKATLDLAAHTRQADVLIVAAGQPGLITAAMVKPGAVVIDAGINHVADAGGGTRLTGDVDFDAVKDVAGAITPVPGGVGPITVAILLRNAMEAARKQTAQAGAST